MVKHPKKAKAKAQAIVMQSTEGGWRGAVRAHHKLELFVVVVVLILLGGVALLRWHDQTATHISTSAAKTQLSEAQSLSNKNKQQEAARVKLENLLAQNPADKQTRYSIETQLADIYASEGKAQAAYEMRQQAIADKSGLTYSDYMALGDNAMANGDKTTALNAYQKALALAKADKSNSVSLGLITYLQSRVDSLQGKKS